MFSLMSLGHEGEVRGLAEAVRDGPGASRVLLT